METDENGRTSWMSHGEAPFPHESGRGRLSSGETDAATLHSSAYTSRAPFPRTAFFLKSIDFCP